MLTTAALYLNKMRTLRTISLFNKVPRICLHFSASLTFISRCSSSYSDKTGAWNQVKRTYFCSVTSLLSYFLFKIIPPSKLRKLDNLVICLQYIQFSLRYNLYRWCKSKIMLGNRWNGGICHQIDFIRSKIEGFKCLLFISKISWLWPFPR